MKNKLIISLSIISIPLFPSQVSRPKNGIGSDFGANFGSETVALIGAGVSGAAVASKGAIVVAATNAKLAVIAAAYAHPYVAVGGAITTAASISGYAVYNYYNPSDEEIIRRNALRIEAAISEKRAAEEEKSLLIEKVKKELTTCFLKNRTNRQLSSAGRPEACEETALILALNEGKSDSVDEMTKLFKIMSGQ